MYYTVDPFIILSKKKMQKSTSFWHSNFVCYYNLVGKVQIFWEGHKNFSHLPHFFWHYLIASNYKLKIWDKFLWPSQNIWTLIINWSLHGAWHGILFRIIDFQEDGRCDLKASQWRDTFRYLTLFWPEGQKIILLPNVWGLLALPIDCSFIWFYFRT